MDDNVYDQEIMETLKKAEAEVNDPQSVALAQAIRDYLSVKGKVIEVDHVTSHNRYTSSEEQIDLKVPALVRIRPSTIHDINQNYCGILAPEWNAELVEPHPEIDHRKYRVLALTVRGTLYHIKTGKSNKNLSSWRPIDVSTLNTEQTEKVADDNKRRQRTDNDGGRNVTKIITTGLANQADVNVIRDAVNLYLDAVHANEQRDLTIEIDSGRNHPQ